LKQIIACRTVVGLFRSTICGKGEWPAANKLPTKESLRNVVVVSPDPFWRMGRDAEEFREEPTVGPCQRCGPEIKNRRSCAKDGAPERLRCGTIQKEVSYCSWCPQALQKFSFRFILRKMSFVPPLQSSPSTKNDTRTDNPTRNQEFAENKAKSTRNEVEKA